jgi:pilus assembly protein CpaE
MSKPSTPPSDGKKKEIIRVLLVDDIPEAREGLAKLLAFETDIDVIGSASTGREGLEMAVEHKPDLILMDINMPDMDGISATEAITKAVPTAAVVMMSVHKDSAYLRRAMLAGARDFLEKPISGDELYVTIRRVYELNANIREQYRQAATTAATQTQKRGQGAAVLGMHRAGHIVTFYSPQGGTGKTTLATNMAAGLMREDSRVLLVDCDLQFGDIGIFLYLESNHNLVDLAEAAGDLDPDLIENVLVTHASGLKVLLAPTRPEDAETLAPNGIIDVVKQLAPNFDFTIVDMRVGIDDLALGLFDISDRIILTGTPTLPTIKSCRQIIDIFKTLGYPSEKIMIAMNRVFEARDRSAIPMEAIEKSLGRPIDIKIPLDEKTFLSAINQGVPVVAKGRGKSPAKELLDAADLLRQNLSPENGQEEIIEDTDETRPISRLGRLFGG